MVTFCLESYTHWCRLFMSLMTAVSGGASLLLLMIPGKYQDHSDLLVTCCDSAEFCQGEDNNNIFIKVFAEPNYNNLTAFCQTDSFGLAAGERY